MHLPQNTLSLGFAARFCSSKKNPKSIFTNALAGPKMKLPAARLVDEEFDDSTELAEV